MATATATQTFIHIAILPNVQATVTALQTVAAKKALPVQFAANADGTLRSVTVTCTYGTKLVMQPNGIIMVQLPATPAPVREQTAQHMHDELGQAIAIAQALNTTGALPAYIDND